MLRCPMARAGAFRQERGCSPGPVKRAVPLLQNETQNMNTTENLIATGCTATAPQPIYQVVKPVKFPAQPQEWKIVSLRECPTPDAMQQCETPDQATESELQTLVPECPPARFYEKLLLSDIGVDSSVE